MILINTIQLLFIFPWLCVCVSVCVCVSWCLLSHHQLQLVVLLLSLTERVEDEVVVREVEKINW